MMHVMIAVDGSDLDAQVAEAAHRLFGDDARYWAVNVQSADPIAGTAPLPAVYPGAIVGYGATYPYVPPEPYRVADVDDPERQRVQAAARAVAEQAGVDGAEVIAEIGSPPTAILRAAREHDADVIVVGNHERGWWSKLLVASVTDDVLDASTVPVLVVKDGAVPEAPAAAS